MSRMTDLVNLAADALDDGRNPFDGPFLAENEITYDECMNLAGLFATGGRLLAYALDHPGIAAGAVSGANAAAAYEALNAALVRWNP